MGRKVKISNGANVKFSFLSGFDSQGPVKLMLALPIQRTDYQAGLFTYKLNLRPVAGLIGPFARLVY